MGSESIMKAGSLMTKFDDRISIVLKWYKQRLT